VIWAWVCVVTGPLSLVVVAVTKANNHVGAVTHKELARNSVVLCFIGARACLTAVGVKHPGCGAEIVRACCTVKRIVLSNRVSPVNG
jgi:hypothetical protein